MATTNARHTPGPWTLRHNNGASVPWGVEGGGWTICEVYWNRYADDPTEECDANARLIAAAPDLLAALTAWVESTDATEQTGSMRPVYDAARAAIRKATTS